jgi:cell wall assembly regulator SMI1/ankyrin repeat protein
MPDTKTFQLARAIGFKQVEEVKQLITDKSLVNTLDEFNNYPLGDAAGRGCAEIVRLLMEAGADVNAVEPEYGSTALMAAAKCGSAEIVKRLIAAGADVNVKDNLSFTALMQAVTDRKKANLEIVKALLAAGAEVNPSGGWWTVLSRACKSGSPDMVRALLAAGADANAPAGCGTPLTVAIEENRADNVAILLEHGADATLRLPADYENEDLAGKNALDVARARKARKIIPLLEAAPAEQGKPGPPTKSPQARSTPPAVAESWKAIDAWLKKNAPELKKTLNRAASEKKVADLEKLLGAELPADFRESLRVHDGQKYAEGDLIPALAEGEEGYFLLSCADIAKEWRQWKDLLDRGEFAGQESGPALGISDAWWNPGWIPFASNGGGDSLCIDLAPAENGVIGQVITMSHEASEREMLEVSFRQWLAELARAVEEGALSK